jgi:hypothetical protein
LQVIPIFAVAEPASLVVVLGLFVIVKVGQNLLEPLIVDLVRRLRHQPDRADVVAEQVRKELGSAQSAVETLSPGELKNLVVSMRKRQAPEPALKNLAPEDVEALKSVVRAELDRAGRKTTVTGWVQGGIYFAAGAIVALLLSGK